MKIYSDITKVVGNTPLVRLNKLTKGLDATVLVKLESMNPLWSVKDVSECPWSMQRKGKGNSRRADNRRADKRKYRHCIGICVGDAWIQTDSYDAGNNES